jgi:lipoyl(octanoyl) transferase
MRHSGLTSSVPIEVATSPIFDLNRHGRDLHLWLRNLEEAMIQTCAEFGLEGRRMPPHTGCWIGDRKVAAIGIKVKRWVSMHGVALNCDGDLGPFGQIVPCGIQGLGVTSLTRETGRPIAVGAAKAVAISVFDQLFAGLTSRG